MFKETSHGSSQECWEFANEYLINGEKEVIERGGIRSGSQIISYDHIFNINKQYISPKFDFGHLFGYTIHKWSKLVNNYVDLNILDLVKSKIIVLENKRKYYNIGFQFTNSHLTGKNCLLSLMFTRRKDRDNPLMTLFIRSSEVTKRFIFDLLLMQRIGEYIYGEKNVPSLDIICRNIYTAADSCVMYHNYKSLPELVKVKNNIFGEKLLQQLEKALTVDIKTIKYRIELRGIRQIQKDEDGNPISKRGNLFAKDLNLFKKYKEYPDNIIAPSLRKVYDKKANKNNA
jgi:hypothetical protein